MAPNLNESASSLSDALIKLIKKNPDDTFITISIITFSIIVVIMIGYWLSTTYFGPMGRFCKVDFHIGQNNGSQPETITLPEAHHSVAIESEHITIGQNNGSQSEIITLPEHITIGTTGKVEKTVLPVIAPVHTEETSMIASSESKQESGMAHINPDNTNHMAVKQIYAKYDEITSPSSLSPYVGRDKICFKDKLADNDYTSKRDGCIACKVDTTNSALSKNYNQTNTNVINTCTYSSNPSDSTIWNKQKCKDECAKVQDVTN